MPRRPLFKVSKRGSFKTIPTLTFRIARGRREGEFEDEFYLDRNPLAGRSRFKSMSGNRPLKFRRSK